MRVAPVMLTLFMIAAANSAAPSHASEQDGRSLHKQVRSGQRVRVYGYVQVDSKCRFSSPPTIQIVTPPTHGTVIAQSGDVVVRDQPRNSLNDCRGQSGPGMKIYYRANKDYTGPDSFSWTASYSNATVAHDTASVDVLAPHPGTAASDED